MKTPSILLSPSLLFFLPRNNLRATTRRRRQHHSTRLHFHHTALQTTNITRAMDFYSLLGFHCTERFRSGPARVAWLESNNNISRLELLEIPPHLQQQQQRAPDMLQSSPPPPGWHHVAVVLSEPLLTFVPRLNATSHTRFGKYLRMGLWPPRQQRMGNAGVFEIAFVYDADGCAVELLYLQKRDGLPPIESGWEPWDGTGFV